MYQLKHDTVIIKDKIRPKKCYIGVTRPTLKNRADPRYFYPN